MFDRFVAFGEVARRNVAAKERRHKRRRIVRFEVSGRVRDVRVSGRVRFIEAVSGENFDKVEKFLTGFLIEAVRDRAGDEVVVELRDFVVFLFTDRFNAGVRARERNVPEPVQDAHDLLLVDHDAVRFGENLFQHRMQVFRFFAFVFNVDVVVDHSAFERARTVEREDGDNVAEVVRSHIHQKFANTGAFELENALRFAAAEERVSFGIVERKRIRVDRFSGRFLNDAHRVGENREVAQAEEVHFQEPGFFDFRALPLRNEFVFSGQLLHRNEVGQRALSDDDAASVRSGAPRQAFRLLRVVDEFANLGVFFVKFDEFGTLVERLFDRHFRRVRNELCNGVDVGQGQAERASDVANRHFRRHRAENAELRDLFRPVVFLNVVDDFAAPRLFEVDVDIRRLDAVFVQKPFEEEVELERANVRHIERVTDDRADAGTAGGAVDAALFRDANEVPNDKEVRRETEFGDDAEFAVEARHNLLRKLAVNQAFRIVGVTSLKALNAKLAEVLVRRFIIRRNKNREKAFAEFEFKVATVGDFERTPNRVFEADGALHHFGAAFEVKFVGVHPHSVRIGAEFPGVDAKDEVLRVGVLAANVVNVV